jgi:diguanylate cyclase (GGDEF)-like protein
VDNFKTVNDTFGHSRGDQLLCLITETMNQHIRQIDAVARLGGDEFALLFPETDYYAAEIVLKRLQKQLLAVICSPALEVFAIESLPISFSIGAVTFSSVPDSIDQILDKVDNLMYDVKLNGKNGIKHQLLE